MVLNGILQDDILFIFLSFFSLLVTDTLFLYEQNEKLPTFTKASSRSSGRDEVEVEVKWTNDVLQ